MNQMSKTKINKILTQHKLWIETNGEKGVCAYLREAILTGANLAGVELWDANLREASLQGANLTGADLRNANLREVWVEGTNFTGANLRDAKLYGVDFSGANMTGASLQGSNLEDADLTNAIGLADISWIVSGSLCSLNNVVDGFRCKGAINMTSTTFIDDSLGFFIQNNDGCDTFDMLVEDKIIRGIPSWVKYSGLSRMPEYLGQ